MTDRNIIDILSWAFANYGRGKFSNWLTKEGYEIKSFLIAADDLLEQEKKLVDWEYERDMEEAQNAR